MTPILSFDIETVPDVAGLRRLRPDWSALDDRAVAAAAFAERTLPFGLIEPSDRLCAAYETVGLFAQLMSRIAPDS